MKTLLIYEVDCYIGNKWNCRYYATDPATQHQILLKDGKIFYPIGRLNQVADAGRFERVVYETEISDDIAQLWLNCVELKKEFKSEYCKTIEEYNEAAAYNKPLKEKMIAVLKEIYDAIDIKMSFDDFVKLSIY